MVTDSVIDANARKFDLRGGEGGEKYAEKRNKLHGRFHSEFRRHFPVSPDSRRIKI